MGYGAWENPIAAARFGRGMQASGKLLPMASELSAKRGALYLTKKTKQGIDRQAPGGRVFKPLSQVTIDRKGSSKALIDKRDLYRSLKVSRVGDGEYLSGVHRNVKSRSGEGMTSIARVHELGYDPAKHGGKGKVVIPARPYIGPTLAVEEKAIDNMVGGEATAMFFSGIGIN